MQPSLAIKQGNNPGQVTMQTDMVTVPITGMVTVPMSDIVTATSSMARSIPNVITINKAGGQIVELTTQNLGSGQPAMIPNMQILNMRPGTPGPVSAQKSVATMSPQVIGTRLNPGITLQTPQSLQQGQQGHLLLKTENGQYQLLRVGPAPAHSTFTAMQTQPLQLSSVPAPAGVSTLLTSNPSYAQMPGQIPPASSVSTPVVSSSVTIVDSPMQQGLKPTITTLKPLNNTKEKCRRFLSNLLELSSNNTKSEEQGVRNLIQKLIDAQMEPQEFCDRLEKLLNASPQPCLIGFLKKSLPLVRQSMVTKEIIIQGIDPPSAHVAFSTVITPTPAPRPALATSDMQLPKIPPKSGSRISILQNIPVHTKLNINKIGKTMTVNSKASFTGPTPPSSALSTVLTQGNALLNEKKETSVIQYARPYVYDKMVGDDDINDVAAMGGVNLAEETQRMLGSTQLFGIQMRSCQEEYLIPVVLLQAKLKVAAAKYGLEEPSADVAGLISHGVHERLKSIIEKLAVIAQHRIDLIRIDARYEQTQDVKEQIKFLGEVDRVHTKRREESERDMLIRAAKSKSKNENPEQALLKAKAKEMLRAEQEELRHREANLTALQAIGQRKKPRPTDVPEGAVDAAGGRGNYGSELCSERSQLGLRVKRINHRDILHLLEQERDTAHSCLLYRSYLK